VASHGDGGSLGISIGPASSVKGTDVDLVGVSTSLKSNAQLGVSPGSVGSLSLLVSPGNTPLASGFVVVSANLVGVVMGLVGSLLMHNPDSLEESLLFKAEFEEFPSFSDSRAGVLVAVESTSLVVSSDLQPVNGQFEVLQDAESVLEGTGHSVDADLVGSDRSSVLLSPLNESSVESHEEDASGSSSVSSAEEDVSSSEPVGDEFHLLSHESLAGSFSFLEGLHSTEEGHIFEGSTCRGKDGGSLLSGGFLFGSFVGGGLSGKLKTKGFGGGNFSLSIS